MGVLETGGNLWARCISFFATGEPVRNRRFVPHLLAYNPVRLELRGMACQAYPPLFSYYFS